MRAYTKMCRLCKMGTSQDIGFCICGPSNTWHSTLQLRQGELLSSQVRSCLGPSTVLTPLGVRCAQPLADSSYQPVPPTEMHWKAQSFVSSGGAHFTEIGREEHRCGETINELLRAKNGLNALLSKLLCPFVSRKPLVFLNYLIL